ncbi:MAG: type II CRISPR-associated endonuclease Cas1 [Clostridia bacterium]|nr:type II CRISPR-associated endonuclease Cas1 [Clostridia bacterium]
MSWRIVAIKSKSKLDYKMDYLVVRNEEKVTRVHISEIAILLIESTSVSMTSYLLVELAKKKVKVIFCDEKSNPISELCGLYGSYDTSRKIKNQISWNEETKKLVWAEIVRAKIKGQISNLNESHQKERAMLEAYAEEVLPGDVTNREGHSAKVYFNALMGKSFSRSDDSVVNSALNYGYGIVLSAFNREIVSYGYITQLGIFHRNTFNAFNLSCDLMEPFRPIVDKEVLKLELTKFEHEEKMQVLNILNEKILINEQSHYLLNAIHIYTMSVIEALEENDTSKIKNPNYEL